MQPLALALGIWHCSLQRSSQSRSLCLPPHGHRPEEEPPALTQQLKYRAMYMQIHNVNTHLLHTYYKSLAPHLLILTASKASSGILAVTTWPLLFTTCALGTPATYLTNPSPLVPSASPHPHRPGPGHTYYCTSIHNCIISLHTIPSYTDGLGIYVRMYSETWLR